MGLEAAAQVLARHDTLFQRLLATPVLVRLSGLANGSHLLVEIQPHSDGQPGVSGRLSVMALPGGLRSAHAPAIVSVPAIGSHPDLSWLQAGAVPLFAHTDTAVANRGGRYGFRVDMQADALAAGIAARLVTLGWTAQHEAPALRRVQSVWRRGPVQMLIFLWGRAMARPVCSFSLDSHESARVPSSWLLAFFAVAAGGCALGRPNAICTSRLQCSRHATASRWWIASSQRTISLKVQCCTPACWRYGRSAAACGGG